MNSKTLQRIYTRYKGYHYVAELPQVEQLRILNIANKFFVGQGQSSAEARENAETLLQEKMYILKDFIEIVKEA